MSTAQLEQITEAELEKLSWNSRMLRLLESEPLGNDFINVLLRIGNMYGGDGWYDGVANTLSYLPLNKTTKAEIDERFSKQLAETEMELKRMRDAVGNNADQQKQFEGELQGRKDYLEIRRQEEVEELGRTESLTKLLRGDYAQRLADSFAGRPMAQDLVQLIADFGNPGKNEDAKISDLYNKIPSVILESVPYLAPNAKLPNNLFYSLRSGNNKPQIDALIGNQEVPIGLKEEIAGGLLKHNARHIGWLETTMNAHRILGEKIGKEMRERIFPLFLQGLLDESTFNQYSQDIARLYQKQPAETQDEKPRGILSRARSYLSRLVNRRTLPIDLSGQDNQDARRRVELMREISGVLKEVSLPDYRKKSIEELVRSHPEHKGEEEIFKREAVLSELELLDEPDKISTFLSEAPLSALERRLLDLTQLRNVPGFVYDLREEKNSKDFMPPYEMSGRIIAKELFYVAEGTGILDHLRKADLDERVSREILKGAAGYMGGNFSWLSQSEKPKGDIKVVMEWILALKDNKLFLPSTWYGPINSIEKLTILTHTLRTYPEYARDMILAERLSAIMRGGGVIDANLMLTDNGGMRFWLRNPPESINWYVLQYSIKQLNELVENDWFLKTEAYREASREEQKHMLKVIKGKHEDSNRCPVIPSARADLEIELNEKGVFANGTKYGCGETRFNPAEELLGRIKEYVSPFVRTVVTAQEYNESGGTYDSLVGKIRDTLRAQAPTHLMYTSLTPPQGGTGTHYIAALDRNGDNKIFAISVRGANLDPNVTGDGERYGGVENYAVLRQTEDGNYVAVTKEEMLRWLSRPPNVYAKELLMSLNPRL